MSVAPPLSPVVRCHCDGGVAIVEIDNPPANVLSHDVRSGLALAFDWAVAAPEVGAIVLLCAGRTFIAGADLKEIGKAVEPPTTPELVQMIESSPKPVLAALHGTALGGGLEIALAAHRRLMAPDAKLGLPEVKLGLVPGAGGTQRLPRLAGVPAAFDIITSGRHLGAAEALRLGIVDAIAEGDLRTAAVEQARAMIGTVPRRTGALPVPPFDPVAMAKQVAAIGAKARRQEAPVEAARLVLAAAELPLDQGLARERATFLRLRDSDQSKALRHLFFAERQAARIPFIAGIEPLPVTTLGVVGVGLMGAGIAVAAADAGLAVIAVVQTAEAASAAAARIDALYERNVASGRLDAAGAAARCARITLSADLMALKTADFVIEAVVDDLDVKRDLFRRLGAVTRPEAVLATNTSYLDPHALAAAVERPERVIGLHFFSPANVMRLVELIRPKQASPQALATGQAVARRFGKLPVFAGPGDGFIGNRIFSAYRRQCEFMLEDGMLPHEIDAALEAHGFALGPFATQDMTGHQISWARRRRADATRDPRERYTTIPDRLYEAGRHGRKAGLGWYAYEDSKRTPDPAVASMIASARSATALRRLSDEEIVTRVVAIMANAGAALVGDGTALRPGDVDLVLVNGYGYPAWRGGPMFEADRLGLDRVLATVETLHADDAIGIRPAPLLVELAARGQRFADYLAKE